MIDSKGIKSCTLCFSFFITANMLSCVRHTATSSPSPLGNVGVCSRLCCLTLWRSCVTWQSRSSCRCEWASRDLQLLSLWPARASMLFRAARNCSLLNPYLQDPHRTSPAGWSKIVQISILYCRIYACVSNLNKSSLLILYFTKRENRD